MPKFKFILHPLFLLFALALVLLNYYLALLAYVITIILHEMAHAFVAAKLGYKLNQIKLMPYGAVLSGENKFFSTNDEVLVAVAGPLLNALLALVCCACFWIFPETYMYTQQFMYANLVTAVINCLPIFPLDGGRVMLAILANNRPRKDAIKIIKILGITLACCILTGFVITVFFIPNYTMLVFGSFLFVSAIIEDKNCHYAHIGLLEDKTEVLERGIKIQTIAVPDTYPLYKLISAITPETLTNFTILDKKFKKIGEISEQQLQHLIEIYPSNVPLSMILSNNQS